jgi:hypothetical protein
MAYPSTWADSFGNNYYRHAQARELSAFDSQGVWDISVEGQPFHDSPRLNITSAEVIGCSIEQMICNMEQETAGYGE